MPIKVGQAIKLIESRGWYLFDTRGSRRQFKHKEIAGRVTVAGKPSDDLSIGTYKSILKQAKIEEND